MKKYLLEIIVFICGAVVMILELAGSRVFAPHLGTSLIVWSSLIGLILGALSFGYWWGGKVADNAPNWKIFSGIIFLSAIFVGLTAIFKEPILLLLLATIKSIQIDSIIAAAILFAPASLMLGMVSPYAVRLKINDVQNSGKTVGNLYAISTLGSIFGTFLAGFYLLATVGTTMILYILAITLIVISIIAFFRSDLKAKIAMIIILVCFGSLSTIAKIIAAQNNSIDTDSAYQRIIIFDKNNDISGRRVRYLKTEDFGNQSGMFLDSDELAFPYTKFYELYKFLKPDAKNTLMIGGAAYTYPQYFLRTTTNTTMTVVEIDPKITQLAKKYFGLTDNPRMKIVHEDGRIFLNNNTDKFDIIFGDAFKSLTPPYQLTTKEAVQKMYNSLNDDGAILLNLISAIDGDKGELLRAEYATYKSVFPEVQVFAVNNFGNSSGVQNIMLVAQKKLRADWNSDNAQLQTMLNNRWTKTIDNDLPILTDDFAPVDHYTLKQVF
jgi:spermidine synthase